MTPLLRIAFTLNGVAAEIAAPPIRRLSAALRDELGLTGTKIGCDAGDCGACTVLLDGAQICACLVAVGQVEGRAVTTIEGLAADPRFDTLRRSFHRHGAAQCGICTPGMLMAAADLLARTPKPDAAMVRDALGGVLCRCTGYRKIVEAVLDLEGDDAPAAPEAGAAVGARLPKVDGLQKLNGTELYGADAAPAGALALRAIRSPHASARFAIGDLQPLRAKHPGLIRILTAADIPGKNSFGIYPDIKDQPVLAEGFVRFRGEAVLALVGDAATIAAIADEEVPILWQEEAPVTGIDAALAPGAPILHEEHPDNILITGRVRHGDVEAALAGSAAIVSGEFSTAFVEHAYIEPEAGYARRVGDRIEIFACTQTPYMDRDEVARILGLAPDRVRIIPSAVGGGFGGKLDLSLQPLIATAAWLIGEPVRCVYTRPESMMSTTKRHPARIRARIGADAEGRLRAVDLAADFNTGAYASWGPTVANRVPVHASGPYAVDAVRAEARAIYTNETPAGAFRGFGVPQCVIATETLLDELAEALGIDPLELRHRNALRIGGRTATGQVLTASAGLAACLEALRPHWRAARAAAEAANARAAGPLRRGVGIAAMWYGIGNTSMSNPSTMRVGIDREARVTLYSGAVDIGQGSNTILSQICADALGVPVGAIHLVTGDTDRTEDAGKTSASRQTYISGAAAKAAGEALRRQILERAGASASARLVLGAGRVAIEDGDGHHELDLAALPASNESGDVLTGTGRFDPPTTPLDADGQGTPYASYAFAAQMAEVTVDTILGTVTIQRITAAHDVGRAVNPREVEGQIHGGIAQGIGLALMEEYIPGRTENLHDYLIPTFGDVPEIACILIEDPDPLGPYGAKGIGEPALVPTAPAILNAVHHATGIRLRRVPATPDRVRAALKEAGYE
jgi:aldehyde oxidoreductase